MPTFLNGLPLHPLLVHAVVVLVPLSALGAVVIAVWPAARRRYGSLVVVGALAALGATYLAEKAGEGLELYLPGSAQLDNHMRVADGLKLWVGALLVLSAALVFVHRRAPAPARREGPGTTSAPATAGPNKLVAGVLALLTVAAAVGAAVVVFQAGDSGARAVWGGDRVYELQR
jgi:hypothetical protein